MSRSSERLKENISPLLGSALEVLSQLKPSSFDWKAGGKHGAGFIAQDVLKVLPDAVSRNETDGYYALSDSYFTPYLVKGVQELNDKDKAQESEIEQLKAEIAELKKQMSELKDQTR